MKAISSAKEIIEYPSKIVSLLSKAASKAKKNEGTIAKFFDDLDNLIRLVKSWASGVYTEVPYRTIILAIAAITYFVWPLDAIPDVTPIIGYVDDAGVIAFVVKSIKRDIDDFLEWEDS